MPEESPMDGEASKHEWHIHFLSHETEDFLKGFVVTFFYFIVLMALIFIPPSPLGIALAITIGPFVAGYKGGHYTLNWKWLGLLAAVIWSSLQLMLILYLAEMFSYYGEAVVGTLEMALILFLFLFNIVFCTIGAKVGSEGMVRGKLRKRKSRGSRFSRA